MRASIFAVSVALVVLAVGGHAFAGSQTTPTFKRDITPFEGPNARANAEQTINTFDLPCNSLTALAFIKSKNNVKIFKAQCDRRKWYVLLQSADGQQKVLEWSGTGEPH